MSQFNIDPNIPALSIRNPWAWSIVEGHKPIENRDWITKYRGPFYVHTGLKVDSAAFLTITKIMLDLQKPFDFPERLHIGGIIGIVDLVDCIDSSDSPWFFGKYGFVLENPRPLPFIPCKGKLSFFKPEVTQ